jgi:predicted DNA-binding transcriptional regulator AlpA
MREATEVEIDEYGLNDADPFYTMENLRKRYCNVSRSTIYSWIKSEGFPSPVDAAGCKSLWLKTEVHAYDLKKIGNRRSKND